MDDRYMQDREGLMIPMDLDLESHISDSALSHAYAWLSEIFLSELTHEDLADLVSPDFVLPRVLAGDSPALAEARTGFWSIREWLAGRTLDEAYLHLAAEYARLFVGPYRDRVSPYESTYAASQVHDGEDSPGLLMGKPVSDMRRFLAAVGAQPVNDRNLSEDHVGFELGLVGWLLSEEGRTEPAASTVLKQVLVHLSAWLPAFATEVGLRAPGSLYHAAACFACALVEDQVWAMAHE